MSDTKADADTGTEETEEQTPDTQEDTSGKGSEEETEDTEEAPSAEAYKKLQAKATRREDALRKAQARVKELEAKEKGDTPEDPEVVANRKLIRASGKTVLAGLGVTDRAAQASVLELINLSDIEVDGNGDPDEDEITERIERLRDALGAGQKQERRTPQRNTADRGGSRGGNTDPTSARMQAFLRNR